MVYFCTDSILKVNIKVDARLDLHVYCNIPEFYSSGYLHIFPSNPLMYFTSQDTSQMLHNIIFTSS